MLTIEEYKLKYPTERIWGSFNDGSHFYPGTKFIQEGFLQFTADTACSWGGPFEGNYAFFVIRDFTESTFGGGSNKGAKVLDTWAIADKLARAKAERNFYQIQNQPVVNERPSLKFPISLWILGNDDTSYTKFYASKEEALQELELFIVNQPLDFSVVYDFGFVFTN